MNIMNVTMTLILENMKINKLYLINCKKDESELNDPLHVEPVTSFNLTL